VLHVKDVEPIRIQLAGRPSRSPRMADIDPSSLER
jgi:hypothetical protein